MSQSSIENWPGWLQRQYRFQVALSDLWLALADHPLIRRIRCLRQHFERLAILAWAEAAEAEREARCR